jgi:hypothetical protein
LDEILGISSKRLVSIINNTSCPENTDSDGSEIELDEHVSLEEISSDSEADAAQEKGERKYFVVNLFRILIKFVEV